MTDTQDEFVGYRAAADYLKLARNTLSSYVSRGIGPREKLDKSGEPERRRVGQYLLPVFERTELDRWKEERPGQGARTDLTPAALELEQDRREEREETGRKAVKAERLAGQADRMDTPVPAFYGP